MKITNRTGKPTQVGELAKMFAEMAKQNSEKSKTIKNPCRSAEGGE